MKLLDLLFVLNYCHGWAINNNNDNYMVPHAHSSGLPEKLIAAPQLYTRDDKGEKEGGNRGGNADLLLSSNSIIPRGNGRLTDHGGQVLTNPSLFVIFYGDWTAATTSPYIDFLTNLGSSNYMSNTRTQLGAGAISLKKSIILTGSSTSISTLTNTASLIKSQMQNGVFPSDAQGVYLVITDNNMSLSLAKSDKSQYSKEWCGYHNYLTYSSKKYAFSAVGTGPGKANGGCSWYINNWTTSPTGDQYVDYSYSVLAHEIAEAISSPLLNKWYDKNKFENGDKCNAYAGAANKVNGPEAISGKIYNAVIGSKQYLLQTNYDNVKDSCPATIW